MAPRNILLLIIAVVFAAGTAMFVRNRANTPPPTEVVEEAAPVVTKRILIAKKDIPPGSFVKSMEALEWKDWPEADMQETHVREGTESIDSFDGAVARRKIMAGEPVTAAVLIKKGAGGFLAAVLEPGLRAVAVAVSPTSGAAGFIFPGDRVDLMVTHRLKTQQTSSTGDDETVISDTFIHNVRVVAVDQMLDNPENKAILAKTVTVEVTPVQAEKIVVAEDLGKISLSLRSLVEETPKTDTAAKKDETGQGGPLEPAKEEADFVSTLQGAKASPQARTFTKGGDVSRVLDRADDARPSILVIRGDSVEQREFFQEGR